MCLLPCVSSPCVAVLRLVQVKRLSSCCGVPLGVAVNLMSFAYAIIDSALVVLFTLWAINLPVNEMKQNLITKHNDTMVAQVVTEVKKQLLPAIAFEHVCMTALAIAFGVWLLLDLATIIGFALSLGFTLTAWALITAVRFVHCPVDIAIVSLVCTLDHNNCLRIIPPNILSICATLMLPLARSVLSSHALDMKQGPTNYNPGHVEEAVVESKPPSLGKRSLPSGVIEGVSSGSGFGSFDKNYTRSIIISYPVDGQDDKNVHNMFHTLNPNVLHNLHTPVSTERCIDPQQRNSTLGFGNVHNKRLHNALGVHLRELGLGYLTTSSGSIDASRALVVSNSRLSVSGRRVNESLGSAPDDAAINRSFDNVAIRQQDSPRSRTMFASEGRLRGTNFSRRSEAAAFRDAASQRTSDVVPQVAGDPSRQTSTANPSVGTWLADNRAATTQTGESSFNQGETRKILRARHRRGDPTHKRTVDAAAQPQFAWPRAESPRGRAAMGYRRRVKRAVRVGTKNKTLRPKDLQSRAHAGSPAYLYEAPAKQRTAVTKRTVVKRSRPLTSTREEHSDAIENVEVEERSILGNICSVMGSPYAPWESGTERGIQKKNLEVAGMTGEDQQNGWQKMSVEVVHNPV